MTEKTTALFPAEVGSRGHEPRRDEGLPHSATIKKSPSDDYVASPSEQYAEHPHELNVPIAPWNNLKVRQAAEYAINRQTLVTVLSTGLDKPAESTAGDISSRTQQIT